MATNQGIQANTDLEQVVGFFEAIEQNLKDFNLRYDGEGRWRLAAKVDGMVDTFHKPGTIRDVLTALWARTDTAKLVGAGVTSTNSYMGATEAPISSSLGPGDKSAGK